MTERPERLLLELDDQLLLVLDGPVRAELHLGIPRLDADAPRASEQLRAAYDAAMRDDTGKPPTSPQPWRSRNRAGEHGPTAAGLALGGGGAG
jgi:hypothetical protein